MMIKMIFYLVLCNITWVLSFNQELHDELLAMMQEDQALRKSYIESGLSNQDLWHTIKQVNFRHINRLKGIIHEVGWPGINLAGYDGDQAAWMLVQHADTDLQFQLKCLELLQEQLIVCNTSPSNIAYLTDRTLINQGKKQRYGTQFYIKENGIVIKPIEDEDTVDIRRKEMGLCSLADYIQQSSQYLSK